jgi:hypothetical protein
MATKEQKDTVFAATERARAQVSGGDPTLKGVVDDLCDAVCESVGISTLDEYDAESGEWLDDGKSELTKRREARDNEGGDDE